jgi:FAD/FMN-containing dehydrogenase
MKPVSAAMKRVLAAVRRDLDGIKIEDRPNILRTLSRDYFWYSPILLPLLDHCRADLVVQPADEAELIRAAGVIAKHRLPVTVRGGGTGNYGQCVPLEGGIVLDVTGLDKVIAIEPGRVRVQAGARIGALEAAVRATGQEILMYPSTKRIATIGGFIAGGSAGIGSVRHGLLRDHGNISRIKVVTLEETPRIIELHGPDIQKVHHAYGTNGIIAELDLRLDRAHDWVHTIHLFDRYETVLRFGIAACDAGLDLFLLTTVEQRFQPFYGHIVDYFPPESDAMFAMVDPAALAAYDDLAASFGGRRSLSMNEAELAKRRVPPAYECAYNHTTLHALKLDRSWTYLQLAYPQPFEVELVKRQMARFGDEVLMHHEFAKPAEGYLALSLPLVKFTTKGRMYEIIRSLEAEGCTVFDPHVYTIEEGGMKTIDAAQIEFKKLADPHGLMNPGKTIGWKKEMARA